MRKNSRQLFRESQLKDAITKNIRYVHERHLTRNRKRATEPATWVYGTQCSLSEWDNNDLLAFLVRDLNTYCVLLTWEELQVAEEHIRRESGIYEQSLMDRYGRDT